MIPLYWMADILILDSLQQPSSPTDTPSPLAWPDVSSSTDLKLEGSCISPLLSDLLNWQHSVLLCQSNHRLPPVLAGSSKCLCLKLRDRPSCFWVSGHCSAHPPRNMTILEVARRMSSASSLCLPRSHLGLSRVTHCVPTHGCMPVLPAVQDDAITACPAHFSSSKTNHSHSSVHHSLTILPTQEGLSPTSS